MAGVRDEAEDQGTASWVFLAAGAVLGVTVGMVLGIATDLPFLPETGLVLGLAAGWLVLRARRAA